MSHGYTREIVCNRKRHRDLAICLFPELATILVGNADGLRSLLGNPGIVNDPCTNWSVTLYCRQDRLVHFGQDRAIAPLGLRDEMMHRLMGGSYAIGSDSRRHGLHAFAIARQHQSRRVRRNGATRSACPKAVAKLSTYFLKRRRVAAAACFCSALMHNVYH